VEESPGSGFSPAEASVPVVGAPAPDFTLLTPEGEVVRLSDLRGQIVLLNFWATWCEPCRNEMPLLNSRYERNRERGFVVLGVNFDESAAEVQAFAGELQISFPLLLDPGAEVQRMYRVRGYPSTFVVDREGRLVAEYIGLIREVQLDEELAQLGLAP
jgi:peroxiredoxin